MRLREAILSAADSVFEEDFRVSSSKRRDRLVIIFILFLCHRFVDVIVTQDRVDDAVMMRFELCR